MNLRATNEVEETGATSALGSARESALESVLGSTPGSAPERIEGWQMKLVSFDLTEQRLVNELENQLGSIFVKQKREKLVEEVRDKLVGKMFMGYTDKQRIHFSIQIVLKKGLYNENP